MSGWDELVARQLHQMDEALSAANCEVERLREALRTIADLPVSTISGDMNFARMLASNALAPGGAGEHS